MKQFKVGDWITGGLLSKPTFIKEESYAQFLNTEYTGIYIELWQPKEGEWCWFYTSESKGRRYINPQLGRFQNFVKQNTNTYKNGYRFVTDVGFYKQCEPFIGELPSFIDKQ